MANAMGHYLRNTPHLDNAGEKSLKNAIAVFEDFFKEKILSRRTTVDKNLTANGYGLSRNS